MITAGKVYRVTTLAAKFTQYVVDHYAELNGFQSVRSTEDEVDLANL